MPHARGCLSDCRSRSHSSDTDLNPTKQLCGSLCLSSFPPSSVQRTRMGFACLKPHTALEVDHDCSLAVQDRFSHPSEVVPVWSACVCPVVLEEISFQSWSWVELAQRGFVQEGIQLGTRPVCGKFWPDLSG